MPKIIFTSRYLRDAPPEQLENYVRYIGTREDVEKIDESKRHLPATVHQKEFIKQLIRDIPQAKEMLEYADFLLRPTIGNASELISCALEQHLDLAGKRENYVDYISNRPRVEHIGAHGLFTDAGKAVVLRQVQEEVMRHKGAVWTHVISLRREDAVRLGYNSAVQWMALLRSKRAMLCRHMKIDSTNLRWYAAFHNESHHPHVHLMVYSAKDNDGYLTKQSIEAMRSELAHDIFRQDFAHIYEEQDQARGNLKSRAADVMRQMMDALRFGTTVNSVIEKKMVQLSGRLQNTGGKKVYGYLKRDVKNLIDEIVDEIAKEGCVDALYQAWGRWRNEILLTYQNQPSSLPPLSRQPEFKSIKNMIIAEAIQLAERNITFDDETMTEPAEIMEGVQEDTLTFSDTVPEQHELYPEQEARRDHDSGWWSKEYKLARSYLYGDDTIQQDLKKAIYIFRQEAEKGNGFAMYDMGRMHADGLGCEIDAKFSQEWYAKALKAFHTAETTAKKKQRAYLQYSLGKMYAAGLGTEHKLDCAEGAKEGRLGRDYETAAQWFSKAVAAEHKYAQYSLACLYYRGQGVDQSYKQALSLYEQSAKQGNPYADYEAAKMYRDGIGTAAQPEKAEQSFRTAFSGFMALERQSHDDKLQYCLGQMLHTGTGTKKDDVLAAEYWEKAARFGNVHAQYSLAKLWLETNTGNVSKGIKWLKKAADGSYAMAQYALGKFYRDGIHVEKSIEQAVYLFLLSAEQDNEYAAYQLGKLYLAGEEIHKDTEKAMKWLKCSAEKWNAYAQYVLGKLYLCGEDVTQDIEKALEYFKASAEQNNAYASYQLGKLYLVGESVRKDVEAAVQYLEMSAVSGNQFAQYVLGKLYLQGKDVPHDKEKAVSYLEESAAQGNLYAKFLLEHLDSFRDPSPFLAATRLLHRLESLFCEDYRKTAGGGFYPIDRRRRRKLTEKKQAQGHKRDDHEPVQRIY